MKLGLAIALILSFVLCASPQKTDDLQWKTILSKKGDLSISVPGDFLVYSVDKQTSLYWGNSDMSYTIRMQSMSDAKRRLWPREYDLGFEAEGTKFISGDFEVIIYTFSKNKFGMSIDLASSKGYYSISVMAKAPSNDNANTILQSILLNGVQLIKRSIEAPSIAAVSVPVTSLKTSQPIKEALKHKQIGKIEVKYSDVIEAKNKSQDIFYSSPLIILKKEAAKYTDAARRSGAQGTIRLSVLFKADGDIGDIIVLNSDRVGLAGSAIDAAKNMKFFPAHIDGKPVDSRRTVEYSFMIY